MTRSTRRFGPWRCLLPLHLAILVAGAGEGLPASGAEGPAAPEPAAARAQARPSSADAKSDPSADAAATPADGSDALDAGVIAFVQEHSPELAAVLAHLERRKPDEYRRALDDVAKRVAPLIGAKTKDPELLALEVRSWQARTRVELLVAQLLAGTTKRREELERKLREAIAVELDAKAAHLGYRKRRSMAWYDRQLDRIREERDELVAERMKSLLRESGRRETATDGGR
ncbi:MAG: hypothetical protein ACKO35_16010 [Planctomycetaceae bacterium]